MKLCIIFLSCFLPFAFTSQLASAQTRASKRIQGKPRAKTVPHTQQPAPSKNLQEEMDQAAEASAPRTREMMRAPESLNTFGDLVYLAPHGKLLADFGLSISSGLTEARANGFWLATARTNAQSASYSVEYGLLENLSIGIGGTYQFRGDSDSESTPGGVVSHTESVGLDDPALTGRFRLLDQNRSFMNMHIVGGYSPKLGNNKFGSGKTTGNNLHGYDTFAIGVEAGKKMSSNLEIAGLLEVIRAGENISEDAATGAQNKAEAQTAYVSKLGVRTGFSFVHLNAAVSYIMKPDYTVTYSSGNQGAYKGQNYFSYKFGLDLDIIKDALIVKTGYELYPTYSSEVVQGVTTINMKTTKTLYTLDLAFQF